ncbi:hypothetical protein [Spirosoma sordidisoli]|uniref:Uncharacterized protein n=1 Tax=Spirosoma sordidisoli TaxID=2502893 RepID=A0A4Q2UDU7_9BACT|nr:hypothetical protein [Spirosoma sordidisoli]RYC67383.1 hypothetical protein EQG79_25045 [Spirosoma sordidisoli]
MYKIVAAVNSMIENQHLIEPVIKSASGGLFFTYNSKFKWSIIENEQGIFSLFYYPGNQSLEELAAYTYDDWRKFKEEVVYSTQELKTKEAIESFSELYKILQTKVFGIDSVLDDIIKTAA